MENSKIKYNNLSTDYNRLLDLLDADYNIICFDAIRCKDGSLSQYSKVIEASKRGGYYDINGLLCGEHSREDILKYLEESNVRFFDIKDFYDSDEVSELKDVISKLKQEIQSLKTELELKQLIYGK